MHTTLQQQIDQCIYDHTKITPELHELLKVVSATYERFDSELSRDEHSLEDSIFETKSSEAFLIATLNAINEGVVVVDGDKKITHYNKRFIEMWGIPSKELASLTYTELVTVMLDKVINSSGLETYLSAAFHVSPVTTTYRIQCEDEQIFQINVQPQHVENKSVGSVLSFRNMTDDLRIEAELKLEVTALERLNHTMIDRELKMIELKTKIKELERRIKERVFA